VTQSADARKRRRRRTNVRRMRRTNVRRMRRKKQGSGGVWSDYITGRF